MIKRIFGLHQQEAQAENNTLNTHSLVLTRSLEPLAAQLDNLFPDNGLWRDIITGNGDVLRTMFDPEITDSPLTFKNAQDPKINNINKLLRDTLESLTLTMKQLGEGEVKLRLNRLYSNLIVVYAKASEEYSRRSR